MKVSSKSGMVLLVAGLILLNGCGSKQVKTTGYLTDYSQLRARGDSTMIYLDESALSQYSAFIVEPVRVNIYHEEETTSKLSSSQQRELTSYLRDRFIKAVQDSGNQVVSRPGPGVARIRSALTDMKKTDMVNIIPFASVTGVGVGGASVEFEILDSNSGRQVAAAIESKKGSRIPLTNLGDWTAARAVMDDWGRRLRMRLE
jgi:hypothetical protein